MSDLLLRVGVTKLALSVVLALVAYVVGRRVDRPVVTHALWMLVPLVLVVPSLITVPLPFTGVSATNALSTSAAGGGVDVSVGLSSLWLAGVKTALVVIWLVGSGLVLVWTLARSIRFHRLLVRASRPAGTALQSLADETARRIGVASSPGVCTTAAQVAPMVWWIGGRVRLVIPTALSSRLGRDPLRWVLAHELAHVRRRDHVMRWLEWLTCVCFWWNPVVWWARRELRAAEEFCCDALVLARLSPQPRAYGGSLLAVIDYLSTPATLRSPAFASAVDSGGRTTLIERRLKKIMSKESILATPRWLRVVLAVSGVGALSLGLVYCDSAQAIGPEAAPAVPELEFEAAQTPPQDGDKARLREILVGVRAAVEAGEITEEQAKQKLAEVERPLAPAGQMTRMPSRATVEIEEVGKRVREAVDAGMITAEEGRRRMVELKARAAAAGVIKEIQVSPVQPDVEVSPRQRDLELSAVRRELELRREAENIRAAVDAGVITEEQARTKIELLRRKNR